MHANRKHAGLMNPGPNNPGPTHRAPAPLIALALCLTALGALTLGAQHAHAGPIKLAVQPETSEIYSGQRLDIGITIAGLDADDLGGFDLDLTFDPSVIQYLSYQLGAELADPDFGGLDYSDDSDVAAGLLQLAEGATLLDLSSQPDAFVLATVSFLALRPGTSALALSNIDLSDDAGDPLTVSNADNGTVGVPIPGTLLLLPLGLGLLRWRHQTTVR